MRITVPSIEHPVDPRAFRAALRKKMLTARAALAMREPATHADFSARIEARLANFLAARSPSVIGFCAPVRGEFDARPLVAKLIAQGWQAAMPVVHQADAPMLFHPWTPDTPMSTDRYGIPIPANSPGPTPRILLLPLVAFDAAGYRLGYGGGYFDRTLAAIVPRPLAIGVGFELSRVDSTFPQAHDQMLDFLVTEAGLEGCKA